MLSHTTHSTVLVVVAHPDDEVLGCGGTLARLAGEGHAVHVSILGEGMTSRLNPDDPSVKKLVATLHDQSQQVASLLKFHSCLNHGLPDNKFDTVPLLDVIKLIEQRIESIRPQVIFTHHGSDLNIDHQIVHRATLTACRPTTSCSVEQMYAMECPSSTEWSFQQLGGDFHPNTFVNIESTLEIKLQACQRYESEIRPFPHPRSIEALRAAAVRWGSLSGFLAAEAFKLIFHRW